MSITKITVGSQGRYNFHHAADITLHIRPGQYHFSGDVIYLTDSQRTRVERHFCGISDCCCGSGPSNMEYMGPDVAVLHV